MFVSRSREINLFDEKPKNNSSLKNEIAMREIISCIMTVAAQIMIAHFGKVSANYLSISQESQRARWISGFQSAKYDPMVTFQEVKIGLLARSCFS
jgi:hypothetical protein